MNDSDIETSQIGLDRLGEWAVEYKRNINPGKSKVRVKDSLNYFGGDQSISEASSSQY